MQFLIFFAKNFKMLRVLLLMFFCFCVPFVHASKDRISNYNLNFELKFEFEEKKIIANISRQNSQTEMTIKVGEKSFTTKGNFFFNGIAIDSVRDASRNYPCISFYDGLNLVAILAYNKEFYWEKNIQEKNLGHINKWEMSLFNNAFHIRLDLKGDSLQVYASSYLMKEQMVVVKPVENPFVSVLDMQIVTLSIRSDNNENQFIQLGYNGKLLLNSTTKRDPKGKTAKEIDENLHLHNMNNMWGME